MNPTCTCGAVLPPDARFCHKCGKPQYEEPSPELSESEPAPPPPPAPAPEAVSPPPISFRNATAVRIGFLTAMAAFAVMLLPLPLAPLRLLLTPLAAGFLSVYWYRRRTGQPLSIRGGAQLGWITGMFCFMIGTVLFTVSILILSQPDLVNFMRQQAHENSQEMDKMIDALQQARESLPLFLVTSLAFLFATFGFIPTLGGALGAKMLTRN